MGCRASRSWPLMGWMRLSALLGVAQHRGLGRRPDRERGHGWRAHRSPPGLVAATASGSGAGATPRVARPTRLPSLVPRQTPTGSKAESPLPPSPATPVCPHYESLPAPRANGQDWLRGICMGRTSLDDNRQTLAPQARSDACRYRMRGAPSALSACLGFLLVRSGGVHRNQGRYRRLRRGKTIAGVVSPQPFGSGCLQGASVWCLRPDVTAMG